MSIKRRRSTNLCSANQPHNATVQARALYLIQARMRRPTTRSSIMVSNVGMVQNPATPATALMVLSNIRLYAANCLVAYGHLRIPMAGLCYDKQHVEPRRDQFSRRRCRSGLAGGRDRGRLAQRHNGEHIRKTSEERSASRHGSGENTGCTK